MSRTVRALCVLMMAALLVTMVSIPGPTGGVAAQSRATVTINPFQDTYVNQAAPTTSYGSSTELWVMADEFLQERRSLLQFLLTDIPAGATINSAELQLYLGYSFGSSNVTMTVERNTEAWAGGTATWNNRPGTEGNWGQTSVGSTTGVYYAWDVTALVQDWHAGTLANYGLTVKGPQEYYERRFDSREGTAQPKLVVEYNVSEPPPDPQGVISGRVWHDDDQDGVRDFGEADLQGVRLDLALGGVVVGTLTTDASGLYSFTGLAAGAYSLSVDDSTLPGAYQLATGSDPRLVTLIADDTTLNGIDFGYDLPETDLVASSLEVTQAVQDLDNSVRLAAGKRTFVRFHVRSRNGVQPTMASLLAETDGRQAFLLPLNSGMTIDVQPDPQRSVLDHAFLFELPSGFREGTVSLTATLNPILLPFRATHSPLEQTYDNNSVSTSISFEPVPDLNLILYRVGYEVRDTGSNYIAGWSHVNQTVDWLRRAYPVADVWLTVRDLDWGTTGVDDEGRLSDISCGSVHTRVDGLTSANMPILFDGGVYRSYGLVDDGGGFMRGCSPRPGRSASGPTGSGSFGWDFDGSYGDWYTGHELGHSLDQAHIRGGPPAGGCGDEAGGRNLYNPFGQYRGTISPVFAGDEALVGYDFGTGDIYPPLSHDVMTYCDYQWMSDITYEGLMDRLQSEAAARAASSPAPAPAADGWLGVSGTIDPGTNALDLDPVFVFASVDEPPPTTPGNYAIVLRSASGTELARHPFTPVQSDPGPPAPGDSVDDAGWWVISEFVPAVEGTDRVDIEGPGGALLASVSAGAAAPTVSITAPAGGTVIPGAQVTVSWSANDADGDDLSFLVQYSPDDGVQWENVSLPTSETSAVISRLNLVASSQGRFRVLASDGVHTASAVSSQITVPNATPQIEFVSPENGTTVMQGQTVNLQAFVYDADEGSMPAAMLSWTSSQDGHLGNGEQLSVAELSVGTHALVFKADDGQGGVAGYQVQITVVDDPANLPAPEDALVAGPSPVILAPGAGLDSEVVYVDNEGGDAIEVQAAVDQPWVALSPVSGTTPFSLTLSYAGAELPAGVYTATLALSSPDAPGTTVPLKLVIGGSRQFLPLVLKAY